LQEWLHKCSFRAFLELKEKEEKEGKIKQSIKKGTEVFDGND